MPRRQRLERWALAGLFFLAFLPRALYPVSRAPQWYFRSAQFFDAILRADWAGTLFSPHPGVTVMWLSGATLWGWYGAQSALGLNPPTPLEIDGYAFVDRVAVGVVPLALVTALGILWGWFLLRRLFGRRVAWVAALLWALDPFHLTNSKILHLDALLSTLMMVSALLALVYLREDHLRSLVLSGLLGGLAVLTKVSALFLYPFLLLALLARLLSPSSRFSWRKVLRGVPLAVRDALLWLAVAAVVCFLIWPAVWVEPGAAVDKVVRRGIVEKLEQAHALPWFYRGASKVGDPGPLYYVDVLLFRTTFLTLPFCILGLGLACVQRRRELLLLAGFAFFFLVQMTLGSRKAARYVLPTVVALDVLSAWGIVWWTERMHSWSKVKPVLLAGLLLMVQAVLVLSRHPYYATHYNELMGGSRAAQQVFPLGFFGEGLDLAGRHLESLPGADSQTIGTHFLIKEMLEQYVRAPVHDVADVGEAVDYLVFSVQYTTRGSEYAGWGALWEQIYRFREPEWRVSFDGIPYVWIYRPDADLVVPQSVNATLGDAVRLVGYRLAEDEVAPGDTLLVTLYWRAEEKVERDHSVFLHLQRPDGELVAQRDGPPSRGTRPTSGWKPGELVEDPREVEVPRDAPAGMYALSVGMYDLATMERLEARSADGGRFPDDRVGLATVGVKPVVPWWRRVLSGAWVAVLVAGVAWPRIRTRG